MTSPPAASEARLRAAGRRALVGFLVCVAAVDVLLPVGLYAYGEIFLEGYWEMFWGERNAITWWSSVQLLVVGAAAWLNFAAVRLGAELAPGAPRGRAWIWLVFALGFAFLAVDERFELHETVRDEWLKPGGYAGGIPGVRPGDIGLYAYLVVGLGAAWFLLGELRRARFALPLFAGGVVLSAAITVVDALPREIEERLPFFWTSVFEETGELWGQLCFLAAFLAVMHARLTGSSGEPDAASGA